MVKAITDPSGDQIKLFTPVFASVSCHASPPSGLISQILFPPERFVIKAMRFPPGDHFGSVQLYFQ